jgi:hypothetical protein
MLTPNRNSPGLFNFHHGRVEFRDNLPKFTKPPSEACVVHVDIGGDHPSANDLLSRLSASLSHFHDTGSSHDVIFEPSHVVSFHLKSHRTQSSFTSKTPRDGFIYPKSIYMDQFLSHNVEFANQKRAQQRGMLVEVDKLTLQKKTITHFNVGFQIRIWGLKWPLTPFQDKDTLKDLRASIYYFEHVAEANDNLERQAAIDNTVVKLKRILGMIENEVEGATSSWSTN